MRKEALAPVVAAWQEAGIAALEWDGAPAHRARLVRDVGMTLQTQPAAAPKVNPAERVFQELRRVVEGLVYPTLADKVAVVERELLALTADPIRLRRLTGWAWIADTLAPSRPNIRTPHERSVCYAETTSDAAHGRVHEALPPLWQAPGGALPGLVPFTQPH